MVNCIKLIVTGGKNISYLSDIFKINVDLDNKKVDIIMTDGSTGATLTYTKDKTWDRLLNNIEYCAMNDVAITVYENEDELEEQMDAEVQNQRQPGQP